MGLWKRITSTMFTFCLPYENGRLPHWKKHAGGRLGQDDSKSLIGLGFLAKPLHLQLIPKSRTILEELYLHVPVALIQLSSK